MSGIESVRNGLPEVAKDLVKPATNKVDFELFCLAVSAINACEACIQAHEKVLLEGGLGEDAVHDAIRIAATVQAAAVALEIPAALAPVGRNSSQGEKRCD